MKLTKNENVIFSPFTHTYFLGDKALPGVTELMKKHSLGYNYEVSGVEQKVLDNAARMGSKAHKVLEDYDNGEVMVSTPFLRSYKKLGLKVICSEYLISDNKCVASSIDKVLLTPYENTVDLLDVKRTTMLHRDSLYWQLGIYKYLFEMQNPGIKVRRCYALHIIKGDKVTVDNDTCKKPEVVSVATAEEVAELLDCEARGILYEDRNKINPDTLLPAEARDEWLALTRQVAEYTAYIDQCKARMEEIKSGLYEYMLDNNIDAVDCGDYFIKLKRPYEKSIIDSTTLKRKYPDIYDECIRISTITGNINLQIK